MQDKFALLTHDQLDQLLALAQGNSGVMSLMLSPATTSHLSTISTATPLIFRQC